MRTKIPQRIAAARNLQPEDKSIVLQLLKIWHKHYDKNALRDVYYFGHAPIKDLGISVSPSLAKKVNAHIDWAAKCVDWWNDRVQFDGITVEDNQAQDTLQAIFRENDAKNLLHMVSSAALRHSCAFLTVTSGDVASGEPETIISGYPLTASAALYDMAKKRITAGLVVVSTVKTDYANRIPGLVHVFTDKHVISIAFDQITREYVAGYTSHSMGRVPMEKVAYHATLERPFGRSRITRAVRDYVDDAQREMVNMTVAAAFAAAPQKYLMGADKTTAEKLAGTPFQAYIGSIMVGTTNKKGQTPQFGQLSQLSMQPHIEYMRCLASSFSGNTGVPLSSLGVVSDNPSSAEAIYASKEDAVVDIQSYINGFKRSLSNIAIMALASRRGQSFYETMRELGNIDVNFNKPSMPSIVSQSDAMVKQISSIPWLADSDVALRELGYTDEQINQLKNDRRKSQALAGMQNILKQGEEDNATDAGATE